jgi:hypothetical protein
MPTQVQFRRGNNTASNNYVGAAGELAVNTDLGTVHVHDGSTAGGNVLVTTIATQTLTNKTLGNVNLSGNIVPTANLSYNLGSSTYWFNTFYGVSSQAKYADLAENYASDSNYAVGTVVIFGGDKEITTTDVDHSPKVAGVISDKPAYLMNAECTDGQAVALTGRVPCQVQGPVNKGDVLVTSSIPGVARQIDNSKFVPGCILGKSLGTITTTDVATIEVVVGKH